MPKLVYMQNDISSFGNKRKFKLPARLQPIVRAKELNQVDGALSLAMRSSVSPHLVTEDDHSATTSYWPAIRDMNSDVGDGISNFHGS